jgi:hypothetical protein
MQKALELRGNELNGRKLFIEAARSKSEGYSRGGG